MSNWISVEDRMPPKKVAVLIYSPEMDEPITCMYYDPDSEVADLGEWVSDASPNRGGWNSMMKDEVTHWMPLPKPPKP